MSPADAKKLAATLARTSGPLLGGGRLSLRAYVDGDRVVFTGGRHGEHSIAIDVSTPERVVAHWEGYVEANGLALAPRVGDAVAFPSASAWRAGGYRRGRVVSVGPKRARVEYTFPSTGARAQTTVRISELRFGGEGRP